MQDQFEEWDKEDEVTYSTWVITNRIEHSRVQRQFHLNNLIFESSYEVFKNFYLTLLSQNLSQTILKSLQAKCQPHKAIVLIDFSKNYSYVIQDISKGYYWTQDSCSFHPVVIYICEEPGKDLIISSLCIVLDDLKHVAFVYEMKNCCSVFKWKVSLS